MKTEIEMLKERVKFLEDILLRLIIQLDYDSDYQKNYNLIYHEFKNEIDTYEEEYLKNVARIGCRQCLE